MPGMQGMQDIYRMLQGSPNQMQSNAQSFVNPLATPLRNPQMNGMISAVGNSFPPFAGGVQTPNVPPPKAYIQGGGAPGAEMNPFMQMLQQMQGGGAPAPGGQMMNPLMGQMGAQGSGSIAKDNPYNQIMDDKFWTYLLQQMFPQRQ